MRHLSKSQNRMRALRKLDGFLEWTRLHRARKAKFRKDRHAHRATTNTELRVLPHICFKLVVLPITPCFTQRRDGISSQTSTEATVYPAQGTDQRQPTPSTKSGRTEKYLRGVADLFRYKSSRERASPEPESLPTAREQTRSVPAGGKLAAIPSKTRGSVDNAILRFGRKEHDQDRLASGNMNGSAGTGTFMKMTLPALLTGFRYSIDGRNDTKGNATLPSSVVEEQIMEILLEYIHKKLAPTSGQTESASILTDSDAFIHPLVTSTTDKIRFSLGYVDAKQLAKRLDKIALETSTGEQPFHRSRQYHTRGESSAKSLFAAWIRTRRDHMIRWEIAELVKRDLLPLLSEEMKTIIWNTFPEALLPTLPTLRLPLFDDDPHPDASAVRNPTTFSDTCNLLSEALRSCPSTAAARELLIDWIFSERQKRINSGQGWHLCLSPGVAEISGTYEKREVARILEQMGAGLEHRRIIEEVRALFNLQAESQAELQGLGPKRHGIGSPTTPVVSQAQDCYSTGTTMNRSRKAFKATKTNQNSVQDENPASTRDPKPSRSAKLSSTDIVGLDTSACSESTHHDSRYMALSLLKRKEAPREARSIQPDDRIPETAGPAMALNVGIICEDGALEGTRQSEESTGAVTNATSVLATRDSLSNGSHDSALSTSKSLLGKRAERLAVVTTDLAGGKLNHTRLPVDGTSLTSAISLSSPVPGLPRRNVSPITLANAFLVPHLPDASGRKGYGVQIGGPSSNREGSTLLDDSPALDSQASSAEHQSSHRIRSTLSRLNSSYFESPQDRFSSRHQLGNPISSTTSPSGLSFILPMFNQDCSVESSVTAGQLEINLLRMIEAERQKCVASGPWGHRQVFALTWVIENVQCLYPCQRNRPGNANVPTSTSVGCVTANIACPPKSRELQKTSIFKTGYCGQRNVKDLFRQKPRYQSASFVVTISTPATAILVVAPAPEPNLARFRTWRRVLQRSRPSGLVTTLQRCAWRPCVDTADIRFQ
ncbi:hypothetical protein QFC20_006866 [Naganishia adeliensis]|uniref:Uncharacterized protein n=1 Tax=Naganishia adeliensis TaxID=92952 RepID=A0ACC2V679_9TREE|nr:hypothetical protein QFC20_006866 [Naganishia adeliensis]